MLHNITSFLKILLLGQEKARPENELVSAYKNQRENIRRIWTNNTYRDFGIERVIRLFLALAYYISPGLYIRYRFERYGLLGRKLCVEAYTLLKLFLPIIAFALGWTHYWPVALIAVVATVETVLYLLTLIFLSNEFASPISHRRSLTLLLINYIQVCLDYAVVYSYLDSRYCIFKEGLVSGMQAIYFSFATSATVGYGDVVVSSPLGQLLVITQIVLFLVFAALFINFFVSKVQDPTYYNTEVTYPVKWKRRPGESEPTNKSTT